MGRNGVLDNSIELRYLGLVRLSGSIAGASSWDGLARAIGEALETIGGAGPVRLWCTTPDGFAELARDPVDADFPVVAQHELRGR